MEGLGVGVPAVYGVAGGVLAGVGLAAAATATAGGLVEGPAAAVDNWKPRTARCFPGSRSSGQWEDFFG